MTPFVSNWKTVPKTCCEDLSVNFGGRRKFAMRRIAADTLPAQELSGMIVQVESIERVPVDHGQKHGAFRFENPTHLAQRLSVVGAVEIAEHFDANYQVECAIWERKFSRHSV